MSSATSPSAGEFRRTTGFEPVFEQSLTDSLATTHWQALIASMGADVAESVRQTMDGLHQLEKLRRIGKDEARYLQAPLKRLYQSGVLAQRLSHLMSRPSTAGHEPVALNEVVAEAIAHYQQKCPRHQITTELTQLDVLAEPEALASAMDSLLAWGVSLGQQLSLRLVRAKGLPRGELWLHVAELHPRAHDIRKLNSLDWYVLWQLARIKGVKVQRKVERERIRVIVKFDRVMHQHSGLAVLEMSNDTQEAPAFDPEVTEVWSVMPRGFLASMVLTTLEPKLRNLKALTDVRALADTTHVPHCVVSVREVLDTEAFRYWRRCAQEICGRTIAVIEVSPERNVFDVGGFGPRSMARISEMSIPDRLLSAIIFELTHVAGEAT